MNHQHDKAEAVASDLSPSLARALRAVAVAGQEFEPFVAEIVPPRCLVELLARRLIEEGLSIRPAVARIGYRLSPRGWNIIAVVWHRPRQPGRIGEHPNVSQVTA